MRLILLALFIVACAATAVLAAPRLDVVCLAEQALHFNSKDHDRWSCLHYAAARGATGVIETMANYGADVDQRNAAGRTPLAEAAKRGELDAVKLLLAKGAEVDVYDTESGFTPLHLAAQNNHPAVARRLLAAGAEVNARNQWNQTPLWQAAWQAWHGNTEIAHLLMAQGALVDIADDKGHTPLHMAARSGHLPMARYLLDEGAELDNANDKGRTALYQAVLGNHLEVARLLLKSGADANIKAGKWTPLRAALEDEHLEMADLLHAYGASGYEQYAARARIDKGSRLLESENITAAIEQFDSAISLLPENPRSYYYRGLAFHRSGQEQKAASDFRRAIELDPTNASALEWLGAVYNELGDYTRAEEVLAKLVDLRPEYGRAHFLLARSKRGQGDAAQAQNGQSRACTLGYQPACAR